LVDKIVVGADRILKTGHVTNKIGTLPIALSAKFYKIPFYTAAPVSTIDMNTVASKVVIEQRDEREILYVGDTRYAPRHVQAINPAFDITPPELVTGIITNRGIIKQPLDEGLKSILD
jgi:methylthioribose-1-phosphate isomerase